MMTRMPIHSIDDPRLAPYLTLKRNEEHVRQRLFVCQGEKNVTRLLQSRLEVVSLLTTEDWLSKLEPLWRPRKESMVAFIGEKRILEGVINHQMYQGVMAVGRIPAPDTLEGVLERAAPPILLAAVDGMSNADNLGGLVRNCGAFGVHGLIVGETSGSPFLRRAVRSSMGAVFDLPVVEAEDLSDALRRLKERGVRLIAAHARPDAVLISRSNMKGDCCLIFGSEGHGISSGALELCDQRVFIPMRNQVDSLNVAHAAAVILYEAARQRGWV